MQKLFNMHSFYNPLLNQQDAGFNFHEQGSHLHPIWCKRFSMLVTAFLLLTSAVTAQSVQIDVSVSNTTPASTDIFNYRIRYRCASITMHCFNSQIVYTIPDALEIVTAPSPGGNVKTVNVSGNTITITLESPPSAGAPVGALAAGSSGIIATKVRFKCGTNGTPPVPAVGTPVNFTPAGLPKFSVTGTSVTAAPPADVITPVVDACTPPVVPPVTGDISKTINGQNVLGEMAGANTFFGLSIPAHSSSFVVTDIFPAGFYPFKVVMESTFRLSPGFKLEVFSNGSWWDVTNQADNLPIWLSSVAVGAPLLDDLNQDIGSVRVMKTYADGSTTSWGSNLTGIRINTPTAGYATASSIYVWTHIDDSIAPGSYNNCFSTNNPAWAASDCAGIDIPVNLPYITIRKSGPGGAMPISAGIGETSVVPGLGTMYSTSWPITDTKMYSEPMSMPAQFVRICLTGIV